MSEDKNKKDVSGSATVSGNKNSEKKFSHGGQKMTDSPFRVNSDSKEAEGQETNIDGLINKEKLESSHSPSRSKESPEISQKEPEDMFAPLDKEPSGSSSKESEDKTVELDSKNSELKDNFSVDSGNGFEGYQDETTEEELEKTSSSSVPGQKLDKALIKYIVLGVVALIIILVVAFWGSGVLISPSE